MSRLIAGASCTSLLKSHMGRCSIATYGTSMGRSNRISRRFWWFCSGSTSTSFTCLASQWRSPLRCCFSRSDLILRERAVGLAGAFAIRFQGFGIERFNYIFPYSHAACLALLLSLLCAYLTLRHILNQNWLNLSAAGLAAGLAPALQAGVWRCLLPPTGIRVPDGCCRSALSSNAAVRHQSVRAGA